MPLSRNHRFGIISFLALGLAAVLVTIEPWKDSKISLVSIPVAETPPVSISWEGLSDGYPETGKSDTILSYAGFDLAYNESYEQARWVSYVLTRDEIEDGFFNRSDNFRADTSIHTGSSIPADYKGSGFDRGHLAPAADMKWSETAMSQSFLMSNMSPQKPSFNRGIWRKLENAVRDWAVEKDSLYVISGPLLESMDTLIGENEVGVPPYYFKVLVDLSPPDHEMIAFLLPHEGSSADLFSFVLTVDSLEVLTGYDFFGSAPDQEGIDRLEHKLSPGSWN